MEVNDNTKKFYDELEGKCEPEILLEIAKKGIFLYEPLCKYDKIKNHKYVVLISILAEQYFMINNDVQYTELKNIILSNMEYTFTYKTKVINLLIVNEFILNKILNEKNIKVINTFKTIYKEIFLCLYKYKFISTNVFNLFYEYNPDLYYSYEFDIFEFLYYDNKCLLLTKLNNILERKNNNKDILDMLKDIVLDYCRDLNLLIFLSNFFCKNKIQLHTRPYYRVPLFFPLNILKEYANNFFLPNNLFIKCNNKYYEDFLNFCFSDDNLNTVYTAYIRSKSNKDEKYINKYLSFKYHIYDCLEFEYELYKIKNNTCAVENVEKKNIFDNEEEISKNNISDNKIVENTNFSNSINEGIKNIISIKKEENESNDNDVIYYIKAFDNQYDKIYNFNIIKEYYYDEYNIRAVYDPYLIDINKMNTLNFVKTCLNNYDFLNNVLLDPNYIFNINLSTNFGTEILLMRLTYLISLIHNKYNAFIIEILFMCIDNSYITCDPSNRIDIEIYVFEEPTDLELIYKMLTNTPHKIFNSYCRGYY
ncbi:hypothetical protein H8356DRAFT_1753968 [Neocallimastix lanati (nom. inval.)]|nr:hypothetical protein H8356DRAFT_1753968 [Neocallimastix sp. JGI-2020a]